MPLQEEHHFTRMNIVTEKYILVTRGDTVPRMTKLQALYSTHKPQMSKKCSFLTDAAHRLSTVRYKIT